MWRWACYFALLNRFVQIDRHDHYRCVSGYYFPFYEDPRRPLGDTILDGELVIDVEPTTGPVCVLRSLCSIQLTILQVPRIPSVNVNPETKMVETTRLLLFDCLVHNEQNIMSKPLSSRYGVSFLFWLNMLVCT
jgi:mRNA guanylyltransferase